MQFLDKKVVCPYYKSLKQSDRKIVCEGLVCGTSISTSFKTKEETEIYFCTHCSKLDGYIKCNICQSLNRKYGFYRNS